ncbi:MAG: cytochrome P450 [Maricaulaceae bacterium]
MTATSKFAELYTPQSEEYLNDYRAVVKGLFDGTEERIGWYEPWQAWIVTSHELCRFVLSDERLTPNFMKWKFAPPEADDADKNDFEIMLDHGLFRLDRLPHRRVRRLASKAFSARVTGDIISKIDTIVSEVFDELEGQDVFNVASTISTDIPRRSIARLVGVPPENEAVFDKLGWAMVRYNGFSTSPEDRAELLRAALEGVGMLRELITERRKLEDPGDDFIGVLIAAQEGDDRLNDWEVLGIVAAMLAAGSDTASEMHPSILYALLSNPEQFEKLKADPSLMDNAITECLRYESFGKTGLHRYALEDVEVGGITIKKGEQVIISGQAAGLDPAQWERPYDLDIERNLNGNIVFGIGAHVCAGLFLAKAQAKLMLEEFIKRFPDAALDGAPERDPDHYNARHFNSLMIRAKG